LLNSTIRTTEAVNSEAELTCSVHGAYAMLGHYVESDTLPGSSALLQLARTLIDCADRANEIERQARDGGES
jgi:hypothetical protein